MVKRRSSAGPPLPAFDSSALHSSFCETSVMGTTPVGVAHFMIERALDTRSDALKMPSDQVQPMRNSPMYLRPTSCLARAHWLRNAS